MALFTEEQFLFRGLELRSNDNSDRWKKTMKSSQVADFVSTYSVHPKALASIWHDLHTTPLLELRFDDTVQPEHILVVYQWLKSYETEKELRLWS